MAAEDGCQKANYLSCRVTLRRGCTGEIPLVVF